MDITGMVLTAAQTGFSALQTPQLINLFSHFGCESELDQLQNTASTIIAVLLEADSKQDNLPREAQDFIVKLSDAFYDLDDLLDEYNTINRRNQLETQLVGGGAAADGNNTIFTKLADKVSGFISRYCNHVLFSVKMSLEVDNLQRKLDAITLEHQKYGFTLNCEPMRRKRPETGSKVPNSGIIGRDHDKEKIVGLLLQDSNVQHDFSFVAIVGMGGMGKTALAQLVYNDDRIKNGFQKMIWVCVSDDFGVREILTKILLSATGENCGELVMDMLQKKVRQHIEGEKYLVVLDDVWCESRMEWLELIDFLPRGARGSRFLITTRYKEVATVVGRDCQRHDLEGLSTNDSWQLFTQMAFKNGEDEVDPYLIEIGHRIVKKCVNVPLAIRVIGCMLYGQGKGTWEFVENESLLEIKNDGVERTMEILKLSYHHLSPPLKSCFSFCALFPKDYTFMKNDLINLWEAHGYNESQKHASENCFSILVNRSFFQDIQRDKYGDIISCKMHDLIHDLAVKVGNHELWTTSFKGRVTRQVRHMSITEEQSHGYNLNDCWSDEMKGTRTLLYTGSRAPRSWPGVFEEIAFCESSIPLIFSSCRCLRVLDLGGSLAINLPNGIGELVHLRYLDLFQNRNLEVLPESITGLYNLQFLNLRGCVKLKYLPKGLGKLVNLRVLLLQGCNKVSDMPGGMDKLSYLCRLDRFVVGERNMVGGLEELNALTNLVDELRIDVKGFDSKDDALTIEGKKYLLGHQYLKSVGIYFKCSNVREDMEEALLGGLQPNIHIKELEVYNFKGKEFPRWAIVDNALTTSLPSLTVLKLHHLRWVTQLPSFSGLRHLKILYLYDIDEVEYMEEREFDSGDAIGRRDSCGVGMEGRRDGEFDLFFPSLEVLIIFCMPKLKGWWRSSGSGGEDVGINSSNYNSSLPLFPHLRVLGINSCLELGRLPGCPKLEDLGLVGVKEEFSFGLGMTTTPIGMSSLKKLRIDKIGGYKNCLGEEDSATNLSDLDITGSEEESLDSFEQLFESCSASLQNLVISDCHNIKSMGRLQFNHHFTNLKFLCIESCNNMGVEEEEGDEYDVMHMQPWKSLVNLTLLCISKCPNLGCLPEWINSLTSLQSLYISGCRKLKSLPEAIRHLPSLTKLIIENCDELKERCKAPNGEDWPKISHIPHFRLLESYY